VSQEEKSIVERWRKARSTCQSTLLRKPRLSKWQAVSRALRKQLGGLKKTAGTSASAAESTFAAAVKVVVVEEEEGRGETLEERRPANTSNTSPTPTIRHLRLHTCL
jgi:hypothetical protein